jgi:fructosamine-3-kinase
MAKRTYKSLSKAQTTKVKSYTKAGKTQGQIAKLLHVSKQRVSTAQRKAKIGKRVVSPFWKAVKATKEAAGISHKEATQVVFHAPKWGKKRAAKVGKKWISYQERQARMKKLRDEYSGDELTGAINDEMGEYMYGDTPH